MRTPLLRGPPSRSARRIGLRSLALPLPRSRCATLRVRPPLRRSRLSHHTVRWGFGLATSSKTPLRSPRKLGARTMSKASLSFELSWGRGPVCPPTLPTSPSSSMSGASALASLATRPMGRPTSSTLSLMLSGTIRRQVKPIARPSWRRARWASGRRARRPPPCRPKGILLSRPIPGALRTPVPTPQLTHRDHQAKAKWPSLRTPTRARSWVRLHKTTWRLPPMSG
jgi:hypothetical protein